MKQTLIVNLICFIAGLLIGIAFLQPFESGNDHPAGGTVRIVNPDVLLKRFAMAQKNYKHRIDSVEKINNRLQVKVNHTQSALRQTRQENKQLENRVSELVEINSSATDTALLLDNCDTLAATIQDLMIVNQVKDSLYDELLQDHVSQIGLRDSVIVLQQENHDSLKATLDTTLLQQQELMSANKEQQKQLKRQKKGKRLLSAFLVVLAGLTTYSAIK